MSGQVADAGERREALDPLRSFCVTAPAGSGKTELLIQRFLTLLARVENPQEVLAITFTRKAAAEMRGRISSALTLAAEGESPLDNHAADTFELARQVLEIDRQRGWQLRLNPSQLNIKTIDSFCGGLTRQMPTLSRFGGPVAAVDDAWPYYREATRALLGQLERPGPIASDLSQLLLHFDNNWARLEDLLVAMLACRDQWLVTMGTGMDRERAQDLVEHSFRVVCVEALTALSDALAAWRPSLEPLWLFSRGNLGESDIPWPGVSTADVAGWQSLARLLLTGEGQWRRAVDKRIGFPADKGAAAEHKRDMQALLKELGEAASVLPLLQTVLQLPVALAGDENWERVLACTRLLPVLAAQLEVVFQQRGVVDHTQVSLAALESLGNDDAPTELALQLDYRLQHILVDEFQDTAANQFELVRRLTRGWAEHNVVNPQAPRTLFIVGDGMQSIYGFRDADVGLFIKAKQQGFDDFELEPLVLRTNFRSDAGLVSWVNSTFASAFPAQDNIQRGEIAFSAAVAFHSGLSEEPVNLRAFDHAHAEATWMAECIDEGMRDQGCRSIAVLVRRKADLVSLVGELKRRGISWQAQEIDALADSMVVRDLQNLCRALHNPADRVAWLALLRAPWCGLENADLLALAGAAETGSVWHVICGQALPSGLSGAGARRVQGLRSCLQNVFSLKQRLGLRDWIEMAWLTLAGPACVEEHGQLEDADAFFSMLSDLESADEQYSSTLLAERIGKLFAKTSASESKLQLMTLHKAKGLEFDWVFIPNLAQAARSEGKDLLLWDEYHARDGEVCFLLAMDDQAGDKVPTLYNYLYEQRKTKRRSESTRLLYVGATRAVQRLFLSACSGLEEGGDIKPPSAGSLLATIWDGISGAVQFLEVDGETQAAAESPDSRDPALLARISQPLQSAGDASRDSDSVVDVAGGITGDAGALANVPEPDLDGLARGIGTVVHEALESLAKGGLPATTDLSTRRDRWRRALRDAGVFSSQEEAAIDQVERSVDNVLADSRGRWLLSPDRQEAASEYQLSCLGEDGRLREYVIDRTYIEDQQRWVVDFKTAMPDSGQSLEEFLAAETERYREQLATYTKLMTALDGRPVRVALYFTAIPYWLEVT